jgi:AraC-like DNA-binding protein
MKATYEQLSENMGSSFLYRQFSLPTFNAPYHFHPELELTFIKKSKGTRFVGRQISHFEAGDLVLLGKNVPHAWLNTEGGDSIANTAQSIVIQFKEDFMGSALRSMPEMKAIHELFQKAQAGIFITGKTRDNVSDKIIAIKTVHPFNQVMILLDILQSIAISTEIELIDPQLSSYKLSSMDTERFQKVYAYIIENYTQDIALDKMAAIAHLTPTAFCRYFKKMTRKTLIEVVTEFRIKHACQLLTTADKPVADVCFESGFGNISYFNKEFKKAIGHSPLNYRKLFLDIH